MTDEEYEEIGQEVRKALHFDLTDVRAGEWGRAAVEAVTNRLGADVPSVEEIKKRMLDSWRSGAGSSLVENDARVAHTMMLELQRPTCTAPIHGMSEKDIREYFAKEIHNQYHNAPASLDVSPGAIRNVCAQLAHRLAQPAPVVDPDAEAKRLCWVYHRIIRPHPNYSIDDVWAIQTPKGKNGWRAVAAAKGGKDE